MLLTSLLSLFAASISMLIDDALSLGRRRRRFFYATSMRLPIAIRSLMTADYLIVIWTVVS